VLRPLFQPEGQGSPVKLVLHRGARLGVALAVGLLWLCHAVGHVHGAGVTLITHGFNGNVTDWVLPMCHKVVQHQTFPGTNFSLYEVSVTSNGQGGYVTTQTLLDGVSPLVSDSGEIVVALDWSTLSSGGTPTTAIAAAVAGALLATNFIPELGGRPLVELPLHLVGHSRGGSVVTELAALLGAEGVWVDHVTTLDPYPVSILGDPALQNYENIFFADNYWQSLAFPTGQAVPGAYNRHLTVLGGGYSLSHSDVHLWYHGTIDLSTPASDTGATITSAERATWWSTAEAAGTNAGFLYSTMGGGDRFSSAEPAGSGLGKIVDGVNQVWDFGAGQSLNRAILPVNNGSWPNLLRVASTATNPVPLGQSLPLSYYHQSGAGPGANFNLRLYLSGSPNPYSSAKVQIYQSTIAGTGTNSVSLRSLAPTPDPVAFVPGTYWLWGQISDGTRTRYQSAPQPVVLVPNSQPPLLLSPAATNSVFNFTLAGIPGQTVVVQASADLETWEPILTNRLTQPTLNVRDSSSPLGTRYYRALLAQ
jgi:pimeloyl-ACP methyl ester carboxylesterase